ncbi:hypothetical protein THASP1DRAFT_22365 [Thamnocephalis sphaerospora]|uniref:Uncharacterized protein n=1 Tax=Thamnocephalis sphaerospora TaxID=78915 RepID=A0A4P9XUE8_9FUNG|nr:hypothetical protein THASP1DRAFT_22365 [Thamnocephalis sphaerospora]|eukprot:RKP09854.1 hypothetical protein THASP1DRAFT_22365 [Thamnocephalis sphaerospora]
MAAPLALQSLEAAWAAVKVAVAAEMAAPGVHVALPAADRRDVPQDAGHMDRAVACEPYAGPGQLPDRPSRLKTADVAPERASARPSRQKTDDVASEVALGRETTTDEADRTMVALARLASKAAYQAEAKSAGYWATAIFATHSTTRAPDRVHRGG